jgi:hypothetical protein
VICSILQLLHGNGTNTVVKPQERAAGESRRRLNMDTSWNRTVESPVAKQQNEEEKVISEE